VSAPKRIQLRRTKGYRKPEGAVVVARPSKWGNPYTIPMMRERCDAIAEAMQCEKETDDQVRRYVVEAFRCDLKYGPDSIWWWFGPHVHIIAINCGLQAGHLRGRDLACWCPLDQPCHADVLLEIANQP
jgi:hypothetical protein